MCKVRLLIIVAATCYLLGGPALFAALPDDVARLVRLLDAQSLAQRDQAEEELLTLGPTILPLLPEVTSTTPAEMAVRLVRVQQKLQERRASQTTAASGVTLSGELSLAEAFAKLNDQTHNVVIDHRANFGEEPTAKQVHVDFRNVPFWEALDDILDQTQMTLWRYGGASRIHTMSRPKAFEPRSRRASYSGPFRLEPLRFVATRELNRQDGSLRFFFEVMWEPRLQPFALNLPLSKVQAVGNNGEKLEVITPEAEPEAPIRHGTGWAELEIPFVPPPGATASITKLHGLVRAFSPGEKEEFRFTRLPLKQPRTPAAPVELRRAGATVSLDEVTQLDERWAVHVRLRFPAPSVALESHRSWTQDNEAFFVDADGIEFRARTMEPTGALPDGLTMTYLIHLPRGLAGMQFVYRTPIAVYEIPVPFEFNDLELP